MIESANTLSISPHLLLEEAREAAEKEAARILANAEATAEEILQNAEEAAAAIKVVAQRDGYAQGERDGMMKSQREIQQMREEFDAFAAELAQTKAHLTQALERLVLPLSLEIARKVIHQEMREGDALYEGFVRLLRQAIEQLNAQDRFIIYLHPQEYERYFAQGHGWLADRVQCAPFSVAADPELPEGSCKLKGPGGIVDAGVDAQLDVLAQALSALG